MSRRLDAATNVLAALAARRPRFALRLADAFGAWRQRVTRRWPTAAEVAAVLPHGDPARLAARIGALAERNTVFVRAVRAYGPGVMRPLVDVAGAFDGIDGACILATFHTGAVQATALALERFGRPVLALRDGRFFDPASPVVAQSTQGSTERRAAAFLRAVEFLRHGDGVALALDDARGASIETQCFGRRLRLARGAFALARISGAPIVPLVARWTRRGIAFATDAPLRTDVPRDDANAYEAALAASAAAWLERYLLANPYELTLGLLRQFEA